jgi:hypothetical protein
MRYLQQYCVDSIRRLDSVSSMDKDKQLASSAAIPDSRTLLARLRMQVLPVV